MVRLVALVAVVALACLVALWVSKSADRDTNYKKKFDRAQALIDELQAQAVQHTQLGADVTFPTIVLDEIRQYENKERGIAS